jgi:hypothetical protein
VRNSPRGSLGGDDDQKPARDVGLLSSNFRDGASSTLGSFDFNFFPYGGGGSFLTSA